MMQKVAEKFASVKGSISDLVYEIGNGVDRKILHRKALGILLSLDEIERMSDQQSVAVSQDDLILKEITRVDRRLRRWANRPHQINTKILTSYLELSQDGARPVSILELKALCERQGMETFDTNFTQMCNIAEKSHGKVFEVREDTVSIWGLVSESVENFKRAIVGGQ